MQLLGSISSAIQWIHYIRTNVKELPDAALGLLNEMEDLRLIVLELEVSLQSVLQFPSKASNLLPPLQANLDLIISSISEIMMLLVPSKSGSKSLASLIRAGKIFEVQYLTVMSKRLRTNKESLQNQIRAVFQK